MAQNRLTVGKVVQSVLPDGTNPITSDVLGGISDQSSVRQDIREWLIPPFMHTDLFAAMGQLCKISGLAGVISTHLTNGEYGIVLETETRELIEESAADWRRSESGPPDYVHDLWDGIIENWDASLDLTTSPEAMRSNADWRRTALLLFLISDGAASKESPNTELPMNFLDVDLWSKFLSMAGRQDNPNRPHDPDSLCLSADPLTVTVLPKFRVPQIGVGLRNLSRTLAILPGRSEIRFRYVPHRIKREMAVAPQCQAMAILTIPFPFSIQGNPFTPLAVPAVTDSETTDGGRTPFAVTQTWIDSSQKREAFLSFFARLISEAKQRTDTIHGIVLPELSVDYELFDALSTIYKELEPEGEFFIAGTSDDHFCRTGNFIATRVWEGGADMFSTAIRGKQQPWRLDRAQIETYGLSSLLHSRTKYWWEDISIGNRELYLHSLRDDFAFTGLICEELARSDVFHDVLRSVGPSMVFALLMDSAQIPERWPGKYASALSDDPGSTVLTLTSYGLVERANSIRGGGSRSIALWKEDGGKTVTFDMPGQSGGVLVFALPTTEVERTLLGQKSTSTFWRYSTHIPISVS